MKRLSLLLVVALGPLLAGCGKHLADKEKAEWIEYWTETCKCQSPGVDPAMCQAKVHKPQQTGKFADYGGADRELISNGGIRCVAGAPR
jgi:outer membrane lipopolysaccharide assembly protein LptE/RlpB